MGGTALSTVMLLEHRQALSKCLPGKHTLAPSTPSRSWHASALSLLITIILVHVIVALSVLLLHSLQPKANSSIITVVHIVIA